MIARANMDVNHQSVTTEDAATEDTSDFADDCREGCAEDPRNFDLAIDVDFFHCLKLLDLKPSTDPTMQAMPFDKGTQQNDCSAKHATAEQAETMTYATLRQERKGHDRHWGWLWLHHDVTRAVTILYRRAIDNCYWNITLKIGF
jgi:hypothetical protein